MRLFQPQPRPLSTIAVGTIVIAVLISNHLRGWPLVGVIFMLYAAWAVVCVCIEKYHLKTKPSIGAYVIEAMLLAGSLIVTVYALDFLFG